MSAVPYSDAQLQQFRDRACEEIRKHAPLREKAAKLGDTPEDLAQDAFLRFHKLDTDKQRSYKDPVVVMVRSAHRATIDKWRSGLGREIASDPRTVGFELHEPDTAELVEENMEQEYEQGLWDAALLALEPRDQKAIVAFEQAGSLRAVQEKHGISKSSAHRAVEHLGELIAAERGEQGEKRTMSRARLLYLGLASEAQREALEARLAWDEPLQRELAHLRFGARRALALFPAPALVGAHSEPGVVSALFGRVQGTGARLRDHALHLVGRGPESEAATGAAGLGGGAVTAKMAIGLCATAASVGGVCVGTGVVPTPGLGKTDTPAATQTTPTPTAEPAPVVAAPVSAAATDASQSVEPTTPVQQQKQEFGAASKANPSGKTREFGAAPTSSSPPSSSGSGGGGGSGGRQGFGL